MSTSQDATQPAQPAPPAQTEQTTQTEQILRVLKHLLGVLYILLPVLLLYLMFKIWPAQNWPPEDSRDAAAIATRTIVFFASIRNGIPVETSLDERLILLVIAAGALGSYIHAATSFSDYVGNRKFLTSWMWWYVMRPFIGAALALVVYFVIRGGFLMLLVDEGREADNVNPYGVAAIAGLVGMFSKQATDKLNEVFSTIFRPEPGKGDEKRGDKLANAVVTAVSPASVPAGSGAQTITVTGSNFTEKSVVHFNGAPRPTRFTSSTQLAADLTAEDTATAGGFELVVKDSDTGVASSGVTFTVT